MRILHPTYPQRVGRVLSAYFNIFWLLIWKNDVSILCIFLHIFCIFLHIYVLSAYLSYYCIFTYCAHCIYFAYDCTHTWYWFGSIYMVHIFAYIVHIYVLTLLSAYLSYYCIFTYLGLTVSPGPGHDSERLWSESIRLRVSEAWRLRQRAHCDWQSGRADSLIPSHSPCQWLFRARPIRSSKSLINLECHCTVPGSAPQQGARAHW